MGGHTIGELAPRLEGYASAREARWLSSDVNAGAGGREAAAAGAAGEVAPAAFRFASWVLPSVSHVLLEAQRDSGIVQPDSAPGGSRSRAACSADGADQRARQPVFLVHPQPVAGCRGLPGLRGPGLRCVCMQLSRAAALCGLYSPSGPRAAPQLLRTAARRRLTLPWAVLALTPGVAVAKYWAAVLSACCT